MPSAHPAELRRRRTVLLVLVLVCGILLLPRANDAWRAMQHDVADFVRGFHDGATAN